MKRFLLISLSIWIYSCTDSTVQVDDSQIDDSSSSSQQVIAGSSANQDILDQIDQGSSSSTAYSSGAIIPYSSTTINTSSSNLYSSSSVSVITDLFVLSSLSDITLPALSQSGALLLQTKPDGTYGILHVDWNGGSTWRTSPANMYFAYTTANGANDGVLAQTSTSWTITKNGSISLGTASNQYKEFLASNSTHLFWVDYGVVVTSTYGGGGGGGGGSTLLTDPKGRILKQAWTGGIIDTLSDTLAYRARLDANDTWLSWVEYAPNATKGVVCLMNISSGQIIQPKISAYHQDRPSVDGDYLVWEEYLDQENSMILAYQISTGIVKTLSSSIGFRTNPDVVGTKVVWEDQRSGNGDLWYYDLESSTSESILISGIGHSAGVRQWGNYIAWIEMNSAGMGLIRGSWQ